MLRTAHRALLLPSLFMVLSMAGCDCKGPVVVPKDPCKDVPGAQADRTTTCTDSSECGDHYACKGQKDNDALQCCVFNDRTCTTEADCCPGQTCPKDRKKCFDKFITCTTDADCGDRGDRFCEPYSDIYGTSTRCRFRACGTLGACAEGQSCFQGECIAQATQPADLPCGGKCEAGKACVATTDQCQDYSSPTGRSAAACPMTCAPGFLASFKDARNLWDSCQLPPVACVCAELPGLRSNDLGRFSAIASDPGQALYVSAYDGQYGDLVVVKYGLDGSKQAIEYVDGVPQDTVTFGPSGARGGVVGAGPDVGRYTDVASAGGKVFVSYYDVTNGDLKVAIRSSTGSWATHRVDGAAADLGLYSSIAIDSNGKPGIAYFQRGGESTFDIMSCPSPRPTGTLQYVTALKFARASSASPGSESDWSVKTIACASRPPPVCELCQTSGANGVCASTDAGTACQIIATGCAACTSSQTCVQVNGVGSCATRVTPANLQEVTPGVGLFASLAFKDSTAVIAYMKRTKPTTGATDGDLYAVTVDDANTVGTPVLLDGNGDTGYFPDVKVQPQTGKIAVGYHDFSSKAFKFWFAPQLQAGVTAEIIDTGNDPAVPGNQSWVGTDSAIVFGAGDTVYALYQDATKGDLKLAKRGASWVVQASPHTEGAVGFFADGVAVDGKLFMSHARIHAKLVKMEPVVDNSLILDSLTSP